MMDSPIALFFVNALREALSPISDEALDDDPSRSRAYRRDMLDGVFCTLSHETRIAFDAEAALLEKARRWVVDDPHNWEMSR